MQVIQYSCLYIVFEVLCVPFVDLVKRYVLIMSMRYETVGNGDGTMRRLEDTSCQHCERTIHREVYEFSFFPPAKCDTFSFCFWWLSANTH